MPRKKTIDKTDLLKKFMEHYLQFGEAPASVYQFAKENNFDEKEFYTHFGSFDGLEKEVFVAFFEQAQDLLSKSPQYKDFDSRNRLLSFYYTFFEILLANRSYVLSWCKDNENPLKMVPKLAGLRIAFIGYFRTLEIERIDLKEERLQKWSDKSLEETAWAQLFGTMKFWIEDSSPGFEKTDMLIEKSINTGFDLLDVKPLKSLFDLGKFLFKEKFHMS